MSSFAWETKAQSRTVLVSDELKKNLHNLYNSIRDKDREKFYNVIENMGIIKDNISQKSKDYIYD